MKVYIGQTCMFCACAKGKGRPGQFHFSSEKTYTRMSTMVSVVPTDVSLLKVEIQPTKNIQSVITYFPVILFQDSYLRDDWLCLQQETLSKKRFKSPSNLLNHSSTMLPTVQELTL